MTRSAIRRSLAAESGITLPEMLVVLLILGIVLAGMTTLFVSAGTTQVDQTNRVEAQRNARLALDALRRELRCASTVDLPVTASELTIKLPGYCQDPVATTPATVTWCTPETSPPFSLWRYEGPSCSGLGVRKAESLVSAPDFQYNRASAGPVTTAVAGPSVEDGFFKPLMYTYLVTAVTGAGEILGSPGQVLIESGTPNVISVNWTVPPGPAPTSYNVYGRDDGTHTNEGLRLLASGVTGTSYEDVGCATPPVPDCSPIKAVDSSLPSPPLATVSFSLDVDVTTADGRQRFKLEDDVVLRNSGRY